MKSLSPIIVEEGCAAKVLGDDVCRTIESQRELTENGFSFFEHQICLSGLPGPGLTDESLQNVVINSTLSENRTDMLIQLTDDSEELIFIVNINSFLRHAANPGGQRAPLWLRPGNSTELEFLHSYLSAVILSTDWSGDQITNLETSQISGNEYMTTAKTLGSIRKDFFILVMSACVLAPTYDVDAAEVLEGARGVEGVAREITVEKSVPYATRVALILVGVGLTCWAVFFAVLETSVVEKVLLACNRGRRGQRYNFGSWVNPLMRETTVPVIEVTTTSENT
eukprot:CAMPEP_0198335146 /NCGR_PEP_ID=MMETSP1450-20131203/20106_1 /TAXON_ID=753684 ORGANISM="Madagascaria erythrocladiodes, Strain CCMP3234" /NCGR_SAMPLE_ID=MMETSP1450 /ASSEMBLY_ACC=CAM_ASM_001115 /LENGTH=281 /DNA_ID=CAMNT_0044039785 /DNA_START=597 /DNA_END=1439 /DNA_ORIENTATION=+